MKFYKIIILNKKMYSYGLMPLHWFATFSPTYLVYIVRGDVTTIRDYLYNRENIPKYIIKNAMNSTDNLAIKEMLGFYHNKDRMRNIIEIERKKVIWKYVFKWLTQPNTNDGLLGIDVRIGLKHLKNLDKAPIKLI